jgi:hypothetical protein
MGYFSRISLVFLALATFAVTPAPAQDLSGEPQPQSFDVFAGNANEKNRSGGFVGSGGYYYAVVTVAPRWEIADDGTAKIILSGQRIMKKEIDRRNPGGLAAISWGIDLMDMENPSGLVQDVTVHFAHKAGSEPTSSAAKIAKPDGGAYKAQIPDGASELTHFDIHWKWIGRNDKTLTFEVHAQLPSTETGYFFGSKSGVTP